MGLVGNDVVRDGSLILRREGYKMGKSPVQNVMHLPPPPPTQDGVKLNAPRPLFFLKGGKILPPPPSVWLKLTKAPVSKLPPPFCRGKTSLAPTPVFLAPPPPSTFN